jgi:F-type H+-transporting ATPase subunit delta
MLDEPRKSERVGPTPYLLWKIIKRIQDFADPCLQGLALGWQFRETVPVADTSQLISGVAERYASSLFELALESGSIDQVGADLDRFQALLDESEDLRRLVASPVFSAEEQQQAIAAVAARAGIAGLVGNFLKVVAGNRRLFAVPGMIRAYREIAALHRGQVTAEVTSAHALSAEQESELKSALKGVTGKDVAIAVTIDPSILGGLIVKVGSRQIDTSLRTKLSTLKLALKEVG